MFLRSRTLRRKMVMVVVANATGANPDLHVLGSRQAQGETPERGPSERWGLLIGLPGDGSPAVTPSH